LANLINHAAVATKMVYEEQARFLVAKYGTASGPVGLPRTWPIVSGGADASLLMVLIGLLIFLVVLALLFREWQRGEKYRSSTYREVYGPGI
jgi:hypothetical protein